ncbi:GNAT family N-acetyltransferase [Mycolicibacterium komossense]|uniref:GNAT family N-acetyltransferase n=1 Tax=Mycolicibacterium komossense TaxID=1779 RepID=A0ABT3C9C7_9MYCO|nr:GNAT family N-acetyltransferase [Mycolicibacterium komossense]MCV7225856.1 GNAT family N-acetyltransferase [Mycolicibacterium komossense]
MEFVERHQPFELSDEYKFGWQRTHDEPDKRWYEEVLDGGLVVARVELHNTLDVGGLPGYEAPDIGAVTLRIHLLEVASQYRGRGIGTRIVAALVARYPERRLVAFSEADDFWGLKLRWDRSLAQEKGRVGHSTDKPSTYSRA